MIQQQKLSSIFKSFNLNDKEISVFLELLKIGSTSVSTWARLTGIKRSSMYVLLAKLKNLHLVKEFPYRGMKYVRALDIGEIEYLFDKKQNEITEAKSSFMLLKEEILDYKKNYQIRPRVRFYEGQAQVEDVYEAVLKEKSFYASFNAERVKEYMPKYHFKIPENVKKNKGTAKELIVNSADAIEYQQKYNSKKHQIKLLPQGITFSSDILIAGDKIYMIGYGNNVENITAIELWSTELAESQKVMFEMLWERQGK